MSVCVFVESNTLHQMKSYDPYTENQMQSKNVKFKLLKDIKEYLSDKWLRLKNGTRSAIDMMAFLSAERGFVYASQLYLSERYGVSDRTIRRVVKDLVEAGLIYIVYQRCKKSNAKGKPIYLFANHPYFTIWADLLNINVHNHVQEETPQKLDLSMVEEQKQIATNKDLLKQESNNNINENDITKYIMYKIKDATKNKQIVIKYVSSYVGKILRSLEKQALYHENLKQRNYRKQLDEKVGESLRETLELSSERIPFYNWLEE